ncbi:MAG: sigma 54-interacting transcriptional regulator [Candidatus Acidiferrales bacterium]
MIGQIEIFSPKCASNAPKWNLGPNGAGMSSPGSSHITDHTAAKAEVLPEVCADTSGESEVTDVSKRYPSRKDLENALLESRESEAQLRRIIDTIPALTWCNLPDGSSEFLNQRWHDYTGLSPEEAHGWGWKAAIHSEDLPMLMQKWEALRDADKPGECEVRLRRFDGAFRSFLCRVEPLRYEGQEAVRWYGTATDIEDHKRGEDVAAGEKLLLEMVTSGHSMPGILEALCQFVESATSECYCSVVLVDSTGTRLEHGAAPSLPASFVTSIIGRPVNAESGPCAMAAYLNEQVIAADLATETRWAEYEWCPMALAHGMRACWSTPIRSAAGEVLGAFAIYYAEPRTPTPRDQALIDQFTHIASITVERERSQTSLTRALSKLRQDEGELRRMTDAIPQTIVVLDLSGAPIYANQATLDYTGLAIEDVLAPGFRERIFHPDDLEKLRDEREAALARGLPFEAEQRALRKDGQYRWFLIRYNPFRTEQGQVIRWYATGTDIDDRVRAEERTRNENLALREQIDRDSMFEDIVGSSEALRKLLRQVSKVAASDSTVLILGETGTGKELIARAIHKRSRRADHAFIGVNCAAIPTSLIASELFGHEKGAFTGATQRRLGRFESANGGTLFLDEVGDLPPEIQIALLRVLQEREIERVGGGKSIAVDVRVLAATHRDLNTLVAEGKFRQDLLYRLNVVPIEIPPLRERTADIPLLVEYFMDRFGKRAGKQFKTIDQRSLQLFQAYGWPGNVRELQNVIERAVILAEGETFSVDEIWLKREPPPTERRTRTLNNALVTQEKQMIEAALALSQGQISGPNGAAARLGLPARTLDSKIKRLKINQYRYKVT